LLILAGEVVFADRPPDALESFQRLAVRVQRFAWAPLQADRSPDRLDPVHLLGFGRFALRMGKPAGNWNVRMFRHP
jgi:hypothetical protein